MFEPFTLKRIGQSNDGLFGVMLRNVVQPNGVVFSIPFAVTVERDHNDPDYKPIEPGRYKCVRYSSEKYPNTWEILVPGHTKVLFHWGNTENDSQMCIILGEQFENILGKDGVAQSKKAFNEFMEITKGMNEFTFSILEWVA